LMPGVSFLPHVRPTEETMKVASSIIIRDAKGNKIPFGSIYEYQKSIVVFVRTFMCAHCRGYARQLSLIPSQALDTSGTKIVLIGCGHWSAISAYREQTSFAGPIYADPTRQLHEALGMTAHSVTGAPRGERPPSYSPRHARRTQLNYLITSTIVHPLLTLTWKHGNISQLGGEFIFGPGQKCSFAHRMEHKEGHIEVDDLMEQADLLFPVPPVKVLEAHARKFR